MATNFHVPLNPFLVQGRDPNMQAEYIRFYHLSHLFQKHLLVSWCLLHPLTLLLPTCHHWISQELPVNHLLSLTQFICEVGWGNIRDCVYTWGWSQLLWLHNFCSTQHICRQNDWEEHTGKASELGAQWGCQRSSAYNSLWLLSFNTGLISFKYQRPLSIWHTRVVMDVIKTEPDFS